MKKILLGTTALVTAAAFAGPASAADKIKLKLDGYATFAVAYVDVDDENAAQVYGTNEDARSITFGSDAEIHFKGKTTLDNGLTIGFKAELELEDDSENSGFDEAQDGSADVIDEVYVELKGGFGEIEFGQQDGVGDQMHYYSPWVFVEHGANDFDLSAAGSATGVGVLSILDDSDDYTKITYITPRIAGFQAGVSYTPEADRNLQGFNGVRKDPGDSILEVAVNFVETFNDIDFAISGAYLTASGDDGTSGVADVDDGDAYSFGTTIGFGGFQIGGSYTERDDDAGILGSSAGTGETTDWDVGATYGTGPWIFGIMYAEREFEHVTTAASDFEDSHIVGGVAYALGPGIQLGLGAEYAEKEFASTQTNAAGTFDELDAFAVFTELALDF